METLLHARQEGVGPRVSELARTVETAPAAGAGVDFIAAVCLAKPGLTLAVTGFGALLMCGFPIQAVRELLLRLPPPTS